MSEGVTVQYVGFEAKAVGREYSFLVREASAVPREFTLSIGNEAFDAHRLRYQDAPEICSLKLHRELAACANHPEETHYRVNEVELNDYRDSHAPKSSGKRFAFKTGQES